MEKKKEKKLSLSIQEKWHAKFIKKKKKVLNSNLDIMAKKCIPQVWLYDPTLDALIHEERLFM